jgi:hypothetical protein
MYLFSVLFFISLVGIVGMILTKIILIKKNGLNPHLVSGTRQLFESLEKIKPSLRVFAKKYLYIFSLTTIKFYVKLTKSLAKIYNFFYKKIHKVLSQNIEMKPGVSKFLKTISRYKNNLRNRETGE